MKPSRIIGSILLSVLGCGQAFAGGGGHNMVIMINPNDENSLRIANAYQRLRDVPDDHFLHIDISSTNKGFVPIWGIKNSSRTVELAAQLVDFIHDRGLHSQVDYIGILGLPPGTGYNRPVGGTWYGRSLCWDQTNADAIAAGADPFDFYMKTSPLFDDSLENYVLGNNTAIKHNTSGHGQYMAGFIGWTGQFGNSAEDVIEMLENARQADGTRPVGTVYFEDNDDIRSQIRRHSWAIAQPKLTQQGIATLHEFGTAGFTPKDRPDVLGAIVGHAFPVLTNGSTYLSGSWADHITSTGASFSTRSQRKCTEFIRSGATGTSGTISEPTANSNRFPHPMIHVYLADGSTFGEAYAKAVKVPDLLMFIGDPLAQPCADVPNVTITSGPAEGSVVSGTIQLGASATLTNPRYATTVLKLQLCIDGKQQATEIAGALGQFNIDTTTLSDGWHELRAVAINNAAVRSQAHVIRRVIVSNQGRQVTGGADVEVAYDQVSAIAVSASGGTVTRVELRQLGRTLGQVNGASGNIPLDAKKLAYGDNPIVPVAIFSDGMVVRGKTFTVTRQTPALLPAQPITPPAQRRYGVPTDYFIGKGQANIENVDFSGTPDKVVLHSRIGLGLASDTSLSDQNTDREFEALAVGSGNALALRFTGRFVAEQSGQYEFFPHATCDSYRLIIDDQTVMSVTGSYSNPVCSVFLEAGEHTFTYLTTNLGTDRYDSVLHMRGPDGISRQMDNTFVYTIADETTVALLAEDDFESRTTGSQIKNYNPPWMALVNGGNSVVVVDNQPAPAGSVKTLHFPYNSAASSQEIVLFRYTGTRVVSYEFDMFVKSRSPFDSALWQARIHPVYGTGSQAEINFRFAQSALGANTFDIRVAGTSLNQVVASGLPMDQWHHLILGVDLVDDGNTGGRYWVYVNGEPKTVGMAYTLANQLNGSIADTSYAYIHNGVSDAKPHLDWYLDNLKVWDGIQTPPVPTVVGRYVFYNRSAWDNNNSGANASDDAAIATDKTPLLPGGTASFVNYTSYTRGINGVMIDIANAPGQITASDFVFKVGNSNTPGNWSSALAPQSVTVRSGAGANGSDRVTIIWADNAIQKTWLQVTLLANANTGLSEDDVFYFGNAIGESGDSSTQAWVNSTDEVRARDNPHTPSNPAPIDDAYDFNRDKLVNSNDQLVPRNNATTPSTALKLITVP